MSDVMLGIPRPDSLDIGLIESLQSQLAEAQKLLIEHVTEFEKDTGKWDEQNWQDRVVELLDIDLSVLMATPNKAEVNDGKNN